MTVTDPSLKPSDRYCLILSEQLIKDGFILKGKKFERLFEHGKQIIDLSFISNFGLIHGVDFSYHIIFDKAEKTFKKLFGKHWANWTVHDILGNLFRYLYNEHTDTYTDKSLNDAALPFFEKIYPKVKQLNARFENYDLLNQEYNQFPSKPIDIVPTIRQERRILMGLLLTIQIQPTKYQERKLEYLERFENFEPFQREQQRQDIYKGIEVLDKLVMNAANTGIASSGA